MTTNLDIPSKKTDLYPIISQKVKKLDRVITDKLMAWRMYPAKLKLHVTDCYGKEIHFEGIEYNSEFRQYFLNGFIEPFLENGSIDILKTTYQMCTERKLTPSPYMNEVCKILRSLNRKTYENMSRTDQRLKGKGYPKRVTPVNVDEKINEMNKFVDSYSIAILKRGKETVAYDWSINKREVYCNGQYITKLPNLQFRLFECLLKKVGKYVKNETLEKCWGDNTVRYGKILPDTMSKIRNKLKKGLVKNKIQVKDNVIEPKQEKKKNISYKLVT